MSFDVTMEVTDRVATIRWEGDLDSKAAPRAYDAVKAAAEADIDRLVVVMDKLNYLASAGLRCLVFAHQKLDHGVEIVLVGAQPEVASVIRMTGFDRSVTMRDTVTP